MAHLSDHKVKKLELQANEIRKSVIEMLVEAGSGHTAGPLGMADIFTLLYFHILKQNPKDPSWPDRDRLILSNGHICPVLYTAMAHAGYFPLKELATLRKLGSRLQGHPHRMALPGLETTSGPLGSGLSQGSGMALAARMDKKNHHVVVLTSDGEHQEGNTWEAVLFAAKYKLDNLIQIMDRNYIQIDGDTEKVLPLDPLKEKYESFNWSVQEINGHNLEEIIDAVNSAKNHKGSPSIILAKTVLGRGVSFMEDQYLWHGKPPSNEELEKALTELEAIRHKIETGTYDY